jgi:hypothetical protein
MERENTIILLTNLTQNNECYGKIAQERNNGEDINK